MKYNKIDKNITKLTINEPINNGIIILDDKYLFDMGKTIGFRNDKKISKFVGLRCGYSKQLEFSLESIKIDDVEKITKKKFSSVKVQGDIIIHKINNIEIYNTIDNSYYKNLVKINNECDNVEILYKLNLKGFKITNKSYKSNDKVVYLENKDQQFIISDNGNNVSQFIIDKPIAFTSDYTSINIVKHELYSIGEDLFYKKCVRDLKIYLNDHITLPILIDANVQFSNKNFYTISKKSTDVLLTNEDVIGYTNWSSFVNDEETGQYNINDNDINLLYNNLSTKKIGTTFNTATDINLSRHFFSFDTSILSNKGKIDVTNAEFNFYYDGSLTSTESLVLKKATFGGGIPSINNWNSYNGEAYNIKSQSIKTFNTSCVLSIPKEDISTDNRSSFMLSLNNYDNLSNYPTTINNLTTNASFKNSSLDIYFNISIESKQRLEFNIIGDNSFGVLESSGKLYDVVLSGNTSTIINVNSSSTGTFNSAFGYSYNNESDTQKNKLYRTYISFDMSLLNSYNDVVIRSISLNFVSYYSKRNVVSLYQKNSASLDPIDETSKSWNAKSTYNHIGEFPISDVGIETVIPLDLTEINNGLYNNFILTDYEYDYLGNFDINGHSDYFNGIDFNTVKLVVDIEPYLIQGIEYKQIASGSVFRLDASMNVENSTFEIRWFSDYLLSKQLGTGNTILLNSNFYNNGDYIYAAIFNEFGVDGIKVSVNTLSILLDIIEEKYKGLPIENRDVSYNVVNLDSTYFKYQNGISGVCYSYARDLNNIYENNLNVSDGDDLGAYNMYNEFDIIDEFFNNSKDVDVVARMNDMNLNLSYKEIDGQTIHQGTRVLLYSIEPSENDGVYVADYNLKLIKTDETSTLDKSFRYKINVKYGTYLDYEFHTFYYDNKVEIPTDVAFNFDIFDSSLYGETIIDMGTYYDRIFDSNI